MLKKFFISLVTFITFFVQADRVLLITHAYNEPEFIVWQQKMFTKLMLDEYEFVVFNDAAHEEMAQKIKRACDSCGVRCFRVPQEIHDRPYLKRVPGERYHRPNIRHVNCCQYSLDILGFDFDGIVGFIDSDMFLTRPLSINKEMDGCDIMSVGRCGEKNGVVIGHLWPGLCFMRMNKLPDKRSLNFNCGYIKGVSVDSGGYSYYYITAHPEIKRKGIDEVWGYQLYCPDRFVPGHMVNINPTPQERAAKFRNLGLTDKEIGFLLYKPDTIQFLLKNSILHYRCGTNYDGQSHNYNEKKKKLINDFLNDILND